MNPDLQRRINDIDAASGKPGRRHETGQRSRKRKAQAEAGPSPEQCLFLEACRAHGLPAPIFEYPFHDGRDWKFDYLFEGWLAVEREGGIFGRGKPCPTCHRRSPGAHSSIQRLMSDMEKYNQAHIDGYVVLRFLPEQLDSGEAFATIRLALDAEEARP